MSKRRAIAFFGALTGLVLGYFAWTAFPRSVEIEWHVRLDKSSRKSAEDYIERYPPEPVPMTWERWRANIIRPFDSPRDVASVVLMKYSNGTELVQIDYPRKSVSLRCFPDGSWEEVDPIESIADDAIPYVGRMFEERTK